MVQSALPISAEDHIILLFSTSPRPWHGTDDLSSAFLTAVGYVIDLATRNEDAHFHDVRHLAHLGAWVSRRDLGFCSGVTIRSLSIQALKPFPELGAHVG